MGVGGREFAGGLADEDRAGGEPQDEQGFGARAVFAVHDDRVERVGVRRQGLGDPPQRQDPRGDDVQRGGRGGVQARAGGGAGAGRREVGAGGGGAAAR
ncbi:hypothetical protein, partial [Actinomadura sediminis]